MGKYKIILNPVSGRGAGELAAPLISQKLRDYNLDFDLTPTERPWHAVELARQAVVDGYDVIISVGGDGTANEVLNGLMQAKLAGIGTATMGMLSLGRGNDFAYGMEAPTNLENGFQAILIDHRRVIDVGRVEGGLYPQGRFFGNGVGIGFDAVVGFEALKMKRLHGFISYLVAALKTIFLYYKAPLVRIEYDDQDITLYTLMVSIMNGRRMGGGFMMAPHGKPDDGLFDICIAEQVSRPKILALIPRFMQGTQETDQAIKTARTNHLTVTAFEGVLPAHADGETLCTEGQQLTMELFPNQLEIIYQSLEGSP